MFDINGAFVLRLMTPEGIRKVPVRFPTDQEYIAWKRKKKITQKEMGRGRYEMQRLRPESCDLTLLTAIRKDNDGPPLEAADALALINQLTDCEVPNHPEQQGNAYVIEMKVSKNFDTKHTLRLPSTKEMMDHQGSSIVNAAYGFQEIRLIPQSAVDLYNNLLVENEGYVGAVPAAHKVQAINVFLQEVESAVQDAPEPDDEDQD